MPSSRAVLSRLSKVRTAAIVILAAGGLWISLSITVAQVSGRNPKTALAWRSSDAAAQAALASRLVATRPDRARLSQAAALSRAALVREPGNVVAARTLGLVATLSHDPRRAQRMLDYAQSLSRRDLPTQFSLIESAVARNDIRDALHHYDLVLRTSRPSRELLAPILAKAAGDPAVAVPLGELMAARPIWWREIVDQVIMDDPDPSTIALILGAMHLDPAHGPDRQVLALGLGRLVEAGKITSAVSLYRDVGGEAARRPLVNGGFDEENGLPPFDWMLREEPGLAGVVRHRPRNGPALFLIAVNGRGGQLARQLLVLPPGKYQFAALVGDVEGDELSRPALSVQCTDGGQSLAMLRFPPASGARPVGTRFRVPEQGCRAQWLILSLLSPLVSPAATPWIDSVRLRRLR